MQEQPPQKPAAIESAPLIEEGASLESKRSEAIPDIDLVKLQELIDRGELPASLRALYEEMRDPSGKTPFLDVYRTADPEKQQKILQALERTAQKMERSLGTSEEKKFLETVLNFVALIYVALLFRTTTQLTGDKTLDPGKNKEGATLRLLELNGAEVFTHPEAFGITNELQFCLDLIDQGHGREVLDHLEILPKPLHAAIVLRCLQVSRMKTGKLEAVYVLETLSHAGELDFAVAEQLCRLGFDELVMKSLEQFQEKDLEKILLLLCKREKVPLQEVFAAILGLKHRVFGEHLIMAICLAKPKIVDALEKLSDEEGLGPIYARIPDFTHQMNLLRDLKAGRKVDSRDFEYIPSTALLKKLLKPHYRDLDLSKLKFLEQEMIFDLVQRPYTHVFLQSLQELTDASADMLSGANMLTLHLQSVQHLSPQAVRYFSDRRGWLVGPEGLLSKSDAETQQLISGEMMNRSTDTEYARQRRRKINAITHLSRATAVLMTKHSSQRTEKFEFDQLKTISPEVASILSEQPYAISLNGLLPPEPGEPQNPFIPKLMYANYKAGPKELSVYALRVIREEVMRRGDDILRLDTLKELSVEGARELAQFNDLLILDGLQDLSPEVARELVQHHGGSLHLNGLHTIKDETIEELSRYQGNLALDGIRSLSVRACEALSSMPGTLWFGGLHVLDKAAAHALASHRGALIARHLPNLSEDVAAELAEYKGELSLGDEALPEGSAAEKIFYQKRGWLPGQEVMSENDAIAAAIHFSCTAGMELPIPFLELLVKCHERDLHLSGITALSDEQLAILSEYEQGNLYLQDLKRLSVGGARALALFPKKIFFDAHIEMDEETIEVMYPFFEAQLRTQGDLPAVGVLALARHADKTRPFSLVTVHYVGPAVAKELSKVKARVTLGVSMLDDKTAACFEMHEGELAFPYVQKLSDRTIASLAKNRGPLSLVNMTSLSEEGAKALAGHKGDLFLNGVSELSDESIKLLEQHDGLVELRGLTTLTKASAEFIIKNAKKSGSKTLLLDKVTHLDSEALSVLVAYEGDVSLNALRRLSAGSIRLFIDSRNAGKRKVSLDGLTHIQGMSPHMAAELARQGISLRSFVRKGEERKRK